MAAVPDSPTIKYAHALGSGNMINASVIAGAFNGGSVLTQWKIFVYHLNEQNTDVLVDTLTLDYQDQDRIDTLIEQLVNGETYFIKASTVNKMGESDVSQKYGPIVPAS